MLLTHVQRAMRGPFFPRASNTLCIRCIFVTCALCMRTVYVQRASNTLYIRCKLASLNCQILTKVGRIIIIIIILFISYIIVQQQDVVSKKHKKVQNMVWPTIQLHGCQIHDYVVSITLVHSITGHSVVTYHNTLSTDQMFHFLINFQCADRASRMCDEANDATYVCVCMSVLLTVTCL